MHVLFDKEVLKIEREYCLACAEVELKPTNDGEYQCDNCKTMYSKRMMDTFYDLDEKPSNEREILLSKEEYGVIIDKQYRRKAVDYYIKKVLEEIPDICEFDLRLLRAAFLAGFNLGSYSGIDSETQDHVLKTLIK